MVFRLASNSMTLNDLERSKHICFLICLAYVHKLRYNFYKIWALFHRSLLRRTLWSRPGLSTGAKIGDLQWRWRAAAGYLSHSWALVWYPPQTVRRMGMKLDWPTELKLRRYLCHQKTYSTWQWN